MHIQVVVVLEQGAEQEVDPRSAVELLLEEELVLEVSQQKAEKDVASIPFHLGL